MSGVLPMVWTNRSGRGVAAIAIAMSAKICRVSVRVRRLLYLGARPASDIQVSTTVSGLSDMLSMPCSMSHCASSG